MEEKVKEGGRGERMERNVEEESSSCERNRRVKIKLDFAFVELLSLKMEYFLIF